ncbi:beta-lactamase/transpeptidase-like protein [Xylariales sp. AK1849]|nr:beta-lactamase/transpeptidase-like protein [Xylariales sp. AK1849]
MRISYHSVATTLFAARLSLVNGAIPNCPYLGPVFPKPTNLASSDTITAAIQSLTSTFETYDNNPDNNPNGTSWSIQVFSASNDNPVWEHYHTGPNANASFVSDVNGDTIYRLGSVTKIFTILTFLIEAGDVQWNRPVTDFIPELQALAAKANDDPIMNTDWGEITLGALASQMAGIVRDYGIEGELTQENDQSTLMSQGFPPAPVELTPVCGEYYLCTRQQLFAGLSHVPPSWGPDQTPGYSNLAYQLLAYALEEITQKNFPEMLQSDVIDKLGLSHTYYSKPADDGLGIIPDGNNGGWAFSLGEASPTGNMYSSVNDLSSLGRAIFNYTLIPGPLTRRWLQPAAMTSDLVSGVGYPWGLRRIPLGTGNDGHRVVDAYGKAGSINAYQSLMVMIPDYDIGIVALLAGGWPGNANWDMADQIGTILLPALETTARLQADSLYAGTYTSSDGALNSTITLSTASDRPGLGVDHWVSNGTDMIPVAVRYTLNYDVTYPAIRLYPTGLESNVDGTRKVAFKAVVENLDAPDQSSKMFSTDCGSWVSQTTAVYADMPLDQFVFSFDADGNVASIQPLALRATMDKVS